MDFCNFRSATGFVSTRPFPPSPAAPLKPMPSDHRERWAGSLVRNTGYPRPPSQAATSEADAVDIVIPRPPRMMFCVGRCTWPGDEGYELCERRCCLLEGHEVDCWCGRQRCAEEMSIARATDTPRGILSTLTMLPQPPRPRGLCSLQCVEGRPGLLRAGHWGFHCCFRSECQCAPLEVDHGFGVRDLKVKVMTI